MLCPPFGGGYTGVYVIGTRAVLEAGGSRSRLKDRESWYIIPDHHPAIIEKAVFDTVQASQLRFSQPNKKKRDYPQNLLWPLRSCAVPHHAENLVLDLKLLKAPLMQLCENHAFSKYDFALSLNNISDDVC